MIISLKTNFFKYNILPLFMIGVHFPHLNVFSSHEKRLSTVRVDTLSLMVDVKDVKDDWLFNNTQSAPDVPWHSAPYEPLYLALFKQSSQGGTVSNGTTSKCRGSV